MSSAKRVQMALIAEKADVVKTYAHMAAACENDEARGANIDAAKLHLKQLCELMERAK